MKKKKKRKTRKIFKYIFIVLLIGILGTVGYLFFNPLILKSDNVTINVGEKYDYKDNIRFVFMGSKEDVKIDKKLDTSKIQDIKTNYTYKDITLPCTFSIQDIKGPELKVKDVTTDTVGDVDANKFVESCEDFSEYKLKVDIKDDEKKKGKYDVIVTATDAYKNTTEKECKLIRKVDDEAPTIEDFKEEEKIMQGTVIDLEDVKVKDDLDPDPKCQIKEDVDFNEPGTYKIEYTVSDRSGNKNTYTKTLTIEENDEATMKVVYLTFDDGPSYNTEKVLDILKKYKVKATFFVTGCGQNKNEYIKRAADEGHAIGLHTYTHDYAYLYSSKDAYYEDLNNVGAMVKELIGYKPDIIRFPGGASNSVSANYCKGIMSDLVVDVVNKGYQFYDWNVSSGDAAGAMMDTDFIIENSCTDSMDQIMLLFHDASGKDTTVEALPKIIEYYKERGYIFRPITKEKSMICHHGTTN